MHSRRDNNAPKKREDATFQFVQIERPGAAVDQDVRRRIKSHVSRLQHRRERQRLFEIASQAKAGDSTPSSRTSASSTHEPADDSQASTATPEARNTVGSRQPTAVWHRAHENDLRNYSITIDPTPPLSQPASPFATVVERSFSRGSEAFRTIALRDADNHIGKSLADLGLDLSNIMSFYRMISIIQAQDFDFQYGVITPGVVSWERFYAYIFTDPMLLTVAILLTIRHQFQVTGRDVSGPGQDRIRIMNIERFLLKNINDALQDPVRSISDQILVAIVLYAAYEIKHGSGECYHIHMRGLLQILGLRGGLREVGRLDPYTERLLLWQDANTAKLAGVEGYLSRLDNNLGTAALPPQANPKVYRLR